MSKRAPKLTKREKKAAAPAKTANAGGGHAHDHGHIHCIACGRHLDPQEFERGSAVVVKCQHGSQFPSCSACELTSQRLLDEHDRTGQPVKTAGAWH
jgi:hypothetical protein